MTGCKFCDKEQSILSVTGRQIPVGEKCYTRLINGDVVWDSETKLDKFEEMLEID